MFVTNVNGTRYRVVFKHCEFGTECLVYNGDREHELLYSIGNSHIVPPDQPRKTRGRKISLTRALLVFDKPTRTQFWKAYQEKQNGQ